MAKLLSNLMVVVGAETGNFDKAVKGIERSLKRTSRELESLGRSMSMAITAPLLAAGGAAVKFAVDAVETENLFTVSLGKMAKAGESWAADLSKSLGLNRYELMQNMGMINQMFRSMGFAEEGAYAMATGLTKLSQDMASFYNLRPDEAFQKLQAGITGEAEPLKRLGILIDENTIKTYAYKNGIAKVGEELTQGQKVLARYGAIMEQTKNAQGDLARTMDSPANQMRQLKSRTEELMTSLGKMLIPTVQSVVKRLTELVKGFSDLDTQTQKNILVFAGVAAAIGPVLLMLSKLTQAVLLLTSVGFLPALIALAGRVTFAFQAMAGGAATFGQALGFIAGPIGWVVTGLAALAAGYIYYNKVQADARAEEEQHQKTIIDLANRYKDLEDQLVKNKKGTVEYQTAIDGIQRLKEEMKKTAPDMLQMFDEEGERVEILTGKLNNAAEAYRELYKASRYKEISDLYRQQQALESRKKDLEKQGYIEPTSQYGPYRQGQANMINEQNKLWAANNPGLSSAMAEANKKNIAALDADIKKIQEQRDKIANEVAKVLYGDDSGKSTATPPVPTVAPGGGVGKAVDPMKAYNEELRRLTDLSREAKSIHDQRMLSLQGEGKEEQRNTELLRYNRLELQLKDLRISKIIAQINTLTDAEKLNTAVGAELRAALAAENFERMQLNKTIEMQGSLLGMLTAELDKNVASIAEWIKGVTNMSAAESVRLAKMASTGEDVSKVIGLSTKPMTAAEQSEWNRNIDSGRSDMNNPLAAGPAQSTTTNVTINATSNDPGSIARATTRALETVALVGA